MPEAAYCLHAHKKARCTADQAADQRHILVKPQAVGVKQEPPLPVTVELARGATPDTALAEAIRERLRNVLVVQTRVDLVPWGSVRRSDYKSQLVER